MARILPTDDPKIQRPGTACNLQQAQVESLGGVGPDPLSGYPYVLGTASVSAEQDVYFTVTQASDMTLWWTGQVYDTRVAMLLFDNLTSGTLTEFYDGSSHRNLVFNVTPGSYEFRGGASAGFVGVMQDYNGQSYSEYIYGSCAGNTLYELGASNAT